MTKRLAMRRYSIEPRTRKNVKEDAFLSIARNLSKNIENGYWIQ